jgi:hypothetical protein
MARYGSDDMCETALIRIALLAWGFCLPACGLRPQQLVPARGSAVLPVALPAVTSASVISGTIFEATKLAYRWFLAMHLLTQSKNNVAALESHCATWAFATKPPGSQAQAMEVMRVREDGRQLDGAVEIDDPYLGGERSGGKVGRGSENKVPFVASQCKPNARPAQPLLHLPTALSSRFTIEVRWGPSPLIASRRPATVVSDGMWCFRAVQAGRR